MVELKVCSFCGKEIEPGTGKMYVKKDGTVFLFCTNKCSKNMIDMGRVPRRTTWTRAYAREKDVRMAGPETAGGAAEGGEEAAEGREKPEEVKQRRRWRSRRPRRPRPRRRNGEGRARRPRR